MVAAKNTWIIGKYWNHVFTNDNIEIRDILLFILAPATFTWYSTVKTLTI